MFTIIARYLTNRRLTTVDDFNASDRNIYEDASSDGSLWLIVLHIRQDLKAVVFLLSLIIFALGVIADLIALCIIVFWWR